MRISEDAIRQFTEQGYRVVVMGTNHKREDLLREARKAIASNVKTVLIVDDEHSPVKFEEGRVIMADPPASMATLLASLPIKMAAPMKLEAPTCYEETQTHKARQQYKHRAKHFRKL